MGMPSMPELLIILTIVVLLFGAKKIPDLAKGIGSGIKNFKKAVKEEDEEESAKPATADKKSIEADKATTTATSTEQTESEKTKA